MLDLYRLGGRLSLRKAGVLIGHLPPESATATALRNAAAEQGQASPVSESDASEGKWSLGDMLLASVIDEIRWLRFEHRQANTKDPGKAPQPVPRPGTAKRRRRLSREQAALIDPRMRGQQDG